MTDSNDLPLIIAVATCGATATRRDNPAIPYSAREIADEIVLAADAGAAMAHVHARTADGKPSQDPAVFQEIIERVRERSDIILELSLGTRGFSLEQSLSLLDLRPEMASFPMEVRQQAQDAPSALELCSRRLLENSTRPSFAITSSLTRDSVADLVTRDLAGSVPCLVVAPEAGEHPSDAARSLVDLTDPFRGRAQWWVMKGGKSGSTQFALRSLAIALGGHVRVGFEDRVTRYDSDRPAPSNAWYVAEMCALADTMGRKAASPSEARAILKLS
jgi:3-keto-5-aminohexanoate cleavage enzyme